MSVTARVRERFKFVCGPLNSKLMNFFYQAVSLEVGRVMPQTDIETLDDLPIKHDPDVEVEIARLTDECIKCLKTGQKGAAKSPAEKIDRLVYRLYGLTAAEQAFVEGKVKL
jgi:hypothetical protein